MMTKTILFLAANPITTDRLRLDEEVREIDNGIRRAKQRDGFVLEQRHALRSEDFRRAMLDHEPEFVHFSGHGSGEDGIILQDNFGDPHLIPTESLRNLFSLFPLTKCVVLNACYSHVQAIAIKECVPYVVGVPHEIDDEIAREFAVSFYEAIGSGKTIEFAYRFGCNAIEMRGVPGDLMPRLLHNAQLITELESIVASSSSYINSNTHLPASDLEHRSALQMAQGCYLAWGKLTVSVTLAILVIAAISFSFIFGPSPIRILQTLRDIAASGQMQTPEYLPLPTATASENPILTSESTVTIITDVPTIESTVASVATETTQASQPAVNEAAALVALSTLVFTLSPESSYSSSQILIPTATSDHIQTVMPLPMDTPRIGSKKSVNISSNVTVTFLYIPAGEFVMGSTTMQGDNAVELCNQFFGNGSDCQRDWFTDEEPQHTAAVDAFWLMETEVTNALFGAFVSDGGYENPQWWTDAGWQWRAISNVTYPRYWADSRWNQPDHPVVGISWYEAVAYAAWLADETGLAVRLPAESEWEKAARGVNGLLFPWGNEWNGAWVNHCDRNCISDWSDSLVDDGYQATAPVGMYAAGASPFGILDMAGNVWEWTSSRDQFYPYKPTDGREDLTGEKDRVVRGGAFDSGVDNYRTANRNRSTPDFSNSNLGMRLVLVD